jgi:hypothetical protein
MSLLRHFFSSYAKKAFLRHFFGARRPFCAKNGAKGSPCPF